MKSFTLALLFAGRLPLEGRFPVAQSVVVLAQSLATIVPMSFIVKCELAVSGSV
jgi:hypothetical protein